MDTIERRESCVWTWQGDEEDYFEGECGAAWCFDNGVEDARTVNFCHNCGGRVTLVLSKEEDDDGA